jgi:hypothetical protein
MNFAGVLLKDYASGDMRYPGREEENQSLRGFKIGLL